MFNETGLFRGVSQLLLSMIVARRRKGLIINLSNEYIFAKGFDERRGFIFFPENSTIASVEVNTI